MQDHCFITPACVANGRPDFMFWQTWVWCAVFLLSSCIVVWYSLDCERVCWLVFLFEVTNCVLMFGVASSQKTSHQFCDCISCPVGQCLIYFCNLFESFCDLSQWTLLWLVWVAVTFQWLVSVTETLSCFSDFKVLQQRKNFLTWFSDWNTLVTETLYWFVSVTGILQWLVLVTKILVNISDLFQWLRLSKPFLDLFQWLKYFSDWYAFLAWFSD